MTLKKNNATKTQIQALMHEDEDLLKNLVQMVVQQVLEAEMDEALAGTARAAGPAGPL
jgi:transposase-like protein